jgi:hypothetical protein
MHNEWRLDEAAAKIVEGFEALTAVRMKIWDVTQCSSLQVKSCACCLLDAGFLLGLCTSTDCMAFYPRRYNSSKLLNFLFTLYNSPPVRICWTLKTTDLRLGGGGKVV